MKSYNFYGHRVEHMTLHDDGVTICLTLTVNRGGEYDRKRQEETLRLTFCEWELVEVVQRYAAACNEQLFRAIRDHKWSRNQIVDLASVFVKPPEITP